ncbi:Uncharacterised protein [Tsukamurella paurometabola]|nr:Uncharacterised protein [Tsukamurella paurometabola]
MAWYFIGLGAFLLVVVLIRDWSTWPDFRTVLAAAMAVLAVAEIGVGVYALIRARRSRDAPTR